MEKSLFEFAVKLIIESKFLVAITGAGISVESGIPSFRGSSGLWEQFDPELIASKKGFSDNPTLCWQFFLELLSRLASSKPNHGHRILSDMECQGLLKYIITQNIDGLHQMAGNRRVIEIHGSMKNLYCTQCSYQMSSKGMIFDSEDLPPMCHCGGILKPDATLFGDSIIPERYFAALKQIRLADVLLIIGTSGMVHPVNEFPEIAIRHGSKVIEINPNESVFTKTCQTLHLKGAATEILSQISDSLGSNDLNQEA